MRILYSFGVRPRRVSTAPIEIRTANGLAFAQGKAAAVEINRRANTRFHEEPFNLFLIGAIAADLIPDAKPDWSDSMILPN